MKTFRLRGAVTNLLSFLALKRVTNENSLLCINLKCLFEINIALLKLEIPTFIFAFLLFVNVKPEQSFK